MKATLQHCILVSTLILSLGIIASPGAVSLAKRAASSNTTGIERPQTAVDPGLYTSEEGRFKIRFPSGFKGPTYGKQLTPSAAGDLENHIFSSETPRGACLVGYVDYPASVFEAGTSKQLLEKASEGSIKQVGGRLEHQEHSTLRGFPRLTISGMAPEKGVYFRATYVLVQPRMYILLFISREQAQLTQPDINAYFDTFQFWLPGATP